MSIKQQGFGMALVVFAIGAWFYFQPPSSAAPETGERTPVVVELFTSEGCSSCPPADQVLTRLVEQQPVAGVEIIALSEHVDYWNRLGWTDPFSSAQFSDRQGDYARAFGSSGVYTPQMVVDGQAELVGSDATQALHAASQAGMRPKAPFVITRSPGQGPLKFRVKAGPVASLDADDTADVYLALTENNLRSEVTKGENQGRKLSHVGVVRRLSVIGSVDRLNPFVAEPVVSLEAHWKPSEMRIVVFAQSRKTRNILAAASLPLDGTP